MNKNLKRVLLILIIVLTLIFLGFTFVILSAELLDNKIDAINQAIIIDKWDNTWTCYINGIRTEIDINDVDLTYFICSIDLDNKILKLTSKNR